MNWLAYTPNSCLELVEYLTNAQLVAKFHHVYQISPNSYIQTH